MKKVSEVLPIIHPAERSGQRNSLLTSTTTAGRTEPAFSPDEVQLVNLVFAKLQACYGAKYNLTYRSEEQVRYAKREWGTALSKVSLDRIHKAFRTMMDIHKVWPPNLAEFLELCNPKVENPQMYREIPPLLCKSTQAERDALAAIHLTALKNKLHGVVTNEQSNEKTEKSVPADKENSEGMRSTALQENFAETGSDGYQS